MLLYCVYRREECLLAYDVWPTTSLAASTNLSPLRGQCRCRQRSAQRPCCPWSPSTHRPDPRPRWLPDWPECRPSGAEARSTSRSWLCSYVCWPPDSREQSRVCTSGQAVGIERRTAEEVVNQKEKRKTLITKWAVVSKQKITHNGFFTIGSHFVELTNCGQNLFD